MSQEDKHSQIETQTMPMPTLIDESSLQLIQSLINFIVEVLKKNAERRQQIDSLPSELHSSFTSLKESDMKLEELKVKNENLIKLIEEKTKKMRKLFEEEKKNIEKLEQKVVLLNKSLVKAKKINMWIVLFSIFASTLVIFISTRH